MHPLPAPQEPPKPRVSLGDEALSGLVAVRVAAALRSEPLPPQARSRLQAARDRALARASVASAARQQPTPAYAGAARLRRGSPAPRWQRALAWLPLLGLVAGLWLLGQSRLMDQARGAADIDALLLADDLPPQAWRDPGFAEFLRRSPGSEAP